MKNEKKTWNSLEVAKLLVSASIPILLFLFTLRANEIFDLNESTIQNNKRIYTERLEIYNQVKKEINQIFCYIYYVGKWKELSPIDMINNKRKCDEIIYSSQILFKEGFIEVYEEFMNSAFVTFSGMGQDAKIKSDLTVHKEFYIKSWDSNWDNKFIRQNDSLELNTRKKIRANYDKFLNILIVQLNIEEKEIKSTFKDFKPTTVLNHN